MTRGWSPSAPPTPESPRRRRRRAPAPVRPRARAQRVQQHWEQAVDQTVRPERTPVPTANDSLPTGRRQARRWLADALARAPEPLDASVRPVLAPELLSEAVLRHLPAASPAVISEEMTALADELTGLGPLAAVAGTPGVSDILVDGAGTVWTDGPQGLAATAVVLPPEQARQLAVRLFAQGGRRLDEGQPYGDVQVAGLRVHAVLPPIAAGGTHLSVRLPAAAVPTLAEVAQHWPHADQWLHLLRRLWAARANLLISGATGSGKTTLLGSLLSEASPRERLVTIEDTRELRPVHDHVVSLQARSRNTEGAGEVPLAELVRQALRMRPDRLIVGECRGAEVADFLAAMNTGHRGAAGTVHANSAADVPARLQAMGALAGLAPDVLALQAASAVDAVLHLNRDGLGRRPVELAVIRRSAHPGGGIELTTVTALTDTGDHLATGPAVDDLESLLEPGTGHGAGHGAGPRLELTDDRQVTTHRTATPRRRGRHAADTGTASTGAAGHQGPVVD